MRIVLSNIGTFGDINPLVALALELKRRGHTPVMALPNVYRPKIEPLGLEFHAIRPDIDPTNSVLVEMVYDIKHGTEHGLRDFLFPSLRQTYDDLLDAATKPARADLLLLGELNYAGPTLGIAADAHATMDALLESLRQRAGLIEPRTSVEELDQYRRQLRPDGDDPYEAYVSALRHAIPRDGIIVQDMTMMSYRMNDNYPAFVPRSYLFPSSYGTLGFSVPAAIGAKIGKPDTPVVAVVGDGGFQFTMQEVATAIQFEVTLPIVIFNDSTYTAVEQAMSDAERERAGRG